MVLLNNICRALTRRGHEEKIMNGAKEIANSGKYAVVVKPVQGFVVLAVANTLTPLTMATDVYFQKLWIYPGIVGDNNKVAASNGAAVYVGKKGVQVKQTTVTLAVADQTVTVLFNYHGLTIGTQVSVRLSGATSNEYNGAWMMTVVDANTLSFALAHPSRDPVTGTITAEYPLALTLTPDVLQPDDLPLKYELPLGQKMRLCDVMIQGAQSDGVFYTLWSDAA
jgi:hypothetical protein